MVLLRLSLLSFVEWIFPDGVIQAVFTVIRGMDICGDVLAGLFTPVRELCFLSGQYISAILLSFQEPFDQFLLGRRIRLIPHRKIKPERLVHDALQM